MDKKKAKSQTGNNNCRNCYADVVSNLEYFPSLSVSAIIPMDIFKFNSSKASIIRIRKLHDQTRSFNLAFIWQCRRPYEFNNQRNSTFPTLTHETLYTAMFQRVRACVPVTFTYTPIYMYTPECVCNRDNGGGVRKVCVLCSRYL